MTAARVLLAAVILGILAMGVGATLSADGGSQGALPAEAHAPGAEVGPAGIDACDLLPLALENLEFQMIFGTEHEAFIALAVFNTLRFSCQGPLSADLAQPAAFPPVHVEGDPGSNFVPVDGTVDPLTLSITANGTGTVAGFPNVTVELELQISMTGEVTGTYTMGAAGELPGGNPGVYEISGQVPLPTASPTPTPETPTQTATPAPQRLWGDVDCDGEITTRDNQAELRFVLQQNALSQTEPCPDIGEGVTVDGTPRTWGDEDCDTEVSTRDNQAKLRFVLQQNALSQTEPCPDVGAPVTLTGNG